MNQADLHTNPISGPLSNRTDVEQAARRLMTPAIDRLHRNSTRLSGLTLAGCDADAAGLEGFARPLWALVPLAAGGGHFDHWDRIREGLTAGTDPNHPDYWQTPRHHDQRLVEMAPIALGLIFARHEMWDPLPPATHDRIIRWLSTIDQCDLHHNNWLFFRILVDLARRAVDVPIDEHAHTVTLDQLDHPAMDGGWYTDSTETPCEQVDWYSSFAHHLYGLVYIASGLGNPDRAEQFEQRARRFAIEHQRWFAPDGTALAFGRSMSYRFAQASFWGALAAANVDALPWSQAKGLYLRNLRHWSTQPIADRSQLLTVGYRTHNPGIAESYISSGSPYWAAKAFLALMANGEHPFWSSTEQPADDERGPWIQTSPGFAITRDAVQVQALSAGQRTPSFLQPDSARYGRLAYSSHFPFVIDRRPASLLAASESTIAIMSRRRRHVRQNTTERRIIDDIVVSRWQPLPEVVIDTALWGRAPWHLRAHHITTKRHLLVFDAGFALPREDGRPKTIREHRTLQLRSGHLCSGITDLTHTVSPLESKPRRWSKRSVLLARTLPGETSLTGKMSYVPTVVHLLRPGKHLIITAVSATTDGRWEHPPPVPPELLRALE